MATSQASPLVQQVGDSVYWHVEGAGDDLLLLHGIGSSSASFDAQFAGLADRFRLHAWDAPGYGNTPDPPAGLTIDDYADLVADRARALGAPERRVHLAGVSFGGIVAAATAAAHPGLFGTLILISSMVGLGSLADEARDVRARAAEIARGGVAGYAERRAHRLVSAAAPLDIKHRVSAIMRDSLRSAGFASAAEVMARTDLTSRLSEIVTPTLIIAASEDPVSGVPAAQRLLGGIPNASYVLIPGAGHLVQIEAADKVNQLIAAFINVVLA